MLIIFRTSYFVGFFFLFCLMAGMMMVAAIPAYHLVRVTWDPARVEASLFFVFFAVILGLSLLMFVNVAFIRLLRLVFPIREGSFSVYGMQMVIWAIQYFMMNFMNTFFLPVFRTTPLMNLFYRLLGARIGRNVFFNSSLIYEPHLLEIGDNSRVGENAVLVPHTTEGKVFLCRKIHIGRNVTIGQYAQILPGAVIGDNVIVGAGAVVPKDKVLASHTIFGGNPLQPLKEISKTAAALDERY